ncbi:MAG: HigA family addiction module antidote protein [Nitrospira sp.]|nr:HigA family addiction module antidote protein [Nitrospira sp.]
MPMKNPPHPGDFIRTELVEPAGLSVTAAAKALQVSRPTLSSLLNGKADLSGEMALRLEKAFGVKMDTLMRMQVSYDIAQTRKRAKHVHVRRLALNTVHS